jgi:hypothetical protein
MRSVQATVAHSANPMNRMSRRKNERKNALRTFSTVPIERRSLSEPSPDASDRRGLVSAGAVGAGCATMLRASSLLVAGVVAALVGCGKPAPDLVRRVDPQPPGIMITDVSVLDVANGTLLPHRNVLIAGDRIKAIESVPIPATGAALVDGQGATLVPGLVDMHGHTGGESAPPWVGEFPDAEYNLRSFLYCGVTTVLDPGDMDSDAFKRRDRLRRGAILGPHVYAAGPLVTAPGGHPVPILNDLLPWWLRWYAVPHYTRQVDTPEEGQKAAVEIAEMGADVMKLVVDRVPPEAPRIRTEVMAAAIDAARARHLRAVAHIGTTQDAIDAARSGVAMWMHGVYRERIPDDAIATLAGFHIPWWRRSASSRATRCCSRARASRPSSSARPSTRRRSPPSTRSRPATKRSSSRSSSRCVRSAPCGATTCAACAPRA